MPPAGTAKPESAFAQAVQAKGSAGQSRGKETRGEGRPLILTLKASRSCPSVLHWGLAGHTFCAFSCPQGKASGAAQRPSRAASTMRYPPEKL